MSRSGYELEFLHRTLGDAFRSKVLRIFTYLLSQPALIVSTHTDIVVYYSIQGVMHKIFILCSY